MPCTSGLLDCSRLMRSRGIFEVTLTRTARNSAARESAIGAEAYENRERKSRENS